MQQRIEKRYRVKGTLVAETPIHVGAFDEIAETDMPVARDGLGRPVIPGSSLAGAFRAWHAHACDDGWNVDAPGLAEGGLSFADRLWGSSPGRHAATDPERTDKGPVDTGLASSVIIEDAVVTTPGGLEVRHSAGIDRVEGRVATGFRTDRQILPKGARIALDLTVEVPAARQAGTPPAIADRAVRAALSHLLKALVGGELRIGAAKTSGLGRIRLLPGYAIEVDDLLSRTGVLSLLRREASTTLRLDDLLAGEADRPRPRPRPQLVLMIDWQPEGPVMVTSGADGISVDVLPLVSGIGDKLAMVIPGSSIKGAIRAQAERIAATVLDRGCDDGATGSSPRRRFARQLARSPLVAALFGVPVAPDLGPSGRAADRRSHQPGQGAVTVEDCVAKGRFSQQAWQQIISAEPGRPDSGTAALIDALNKAGLNAASPTPHIAIDRWTGAATDQAPHIVLDPHGVAWPPMRLSVDLARLPDRDRLAALALLVLTFRDVMRQRVPIGYGGNRGRGTILVNRIAVSTAVEPQEAPDFAAALTALGGLTLDADSWRSPTSALIARLQPLQDAWITHAARHRTEPGGEPE